MKQHKKALLSLSPIITELNHSFLKDVKEIDDNKIINLSFFSCSNILPYKEIINHFPIVLKYSFIEKSDIYIYSFLIDNSFREARKRYLVNFVPYVLLKEPNIFSFSSCSIFENDFIINIQFFKELDIYFYRTVYIKNTYVEHEWKITKSFEL